MGMPVPSSSEKALSVLRRGDSNYSLPSQKPFYLPKGSGGIISPTTQASFAIAAQQSSIQKNLKKSQTLQQQIKSTKGDDKYSIATQNALKAQLSSTSSVIKEQNKQQTYSALFSLASVSSQVGAASSPLGADPNAQYYYRGNKLAAGRIPKSSTGTVKARSQTSNANANRVPLPYLKSLTPVPKPLPNLAKITRGNPRPNSADNASKIGTFNGNITLLKQVLRCY